LWLGSTVASRYFRIEPDMTIAGHSHPMDEDCMLLGEDVFLGDILLLEANCPFAPAERAFRDKLRYGQVGFVRGRCK
jgi:hypothetical protein